jgi:FkbM family methyltransferase
MTFVSYAQNLEDVMLWRALSKVTSGFYIDVGAYDPDLDSVTRVFYECGWRGVNIEPVETCFARLQDRRPRDVNLQVAVAREKGERAFYIIPQPKIPGATQDVSGLSSLDPEIAAYHAANGLTPKEVRLQVTTLTEICREYVCGDIHFLKVDVEGAEGAVLAGADFTRYRPWIVLVEATYPASQKKNHEKWEPILIEANYRFVWFDGLNRYYIAEEKFDEMSHHFEAPPNVFDNFKHFDADTERSLSELRDRAANLQNVLTRTEEQISSQALESDRLKSQVDALQERCATQEGKLGELRAVRIDLENERRLLTEQRDAGLAEIASLSSKLEHLNQRVAVLDELIYRLRWKDGPRALRAVLPLARALRAVCRTQVPTEAAKDFEKRAEIRSDAGSIRSTTVPSRPARNWKKRATLPFYRLIRPIVRPLAWRIRGFLLQDILNRLSELQETDVAIRGRLEEGLNSIANELRNARQDPATSSAIEIALLTLTLDRFGRSD